jgi:ankyrin repeat protein
MAMNKRPKTTTGRRMRRPYDSQTATGQKIWSHTVFVKVPFALSDRTKYTLSRQAGPNESPRTVERNMKSVKLQLLVTLAAVVTAVTLFTAKGVPPEKGIFICSCYGDMDGVRQALNWGTDINTKDDFRIWTPLHWAANFGHKDIVSLLISHGADIEAKNGIGERPLHRATSRGDVDLMELLLACGADANVRRDDGETPLNAPIYSNEEAAIKCLFAYGAQVNTQSNRGVTPLYAAASRNKVEVMKLLMANGASIDLGDNDGWTPLHAAAYWQSKNAVELLLAHGAEVDKRDNKGKTPLQCAILGNNKEVVDLLRQHGAKE